MANIRQKKSLGQHWLKDSQALEAIAEYAEIKKTDTILEVGPGMGNLTCYLTPQAGQVIAVEVDRSLANNLKKSAPKNLSVQEGDILKFNLEGLPAGYKVVANIPYYLTGNLIKNFADSPNPPKQMVLLVQKEVARRVCARPGQMSILAISVQLYYQPELGIVVPADDFEPPPKVDSQVLILHKHPKPPFKGLDAGVFFQVVRAGFSAKRKKLQSSLSGGLNLPKPKVITLLTNSGIDPSLRAQNLSISDWYNLHKHYKNLV